MKKSPLEELFAEQIQVEGLPEPVRELQFCPPRKFRFDFAWPDKKIAVEIQGGVYIRGRHLRAKGYETDCEKMNLAMLLGWHVFQFTARHIHLKLAIDVLKKALSRTT